MFVVVVIGAFTGGLALSVVQPSAHRTGAEGAEHRTVATRPAEMAITRISKWANIRPARSGTAAAKRAYGPRLVSVGGFDSAMAESSSRRTIAN